MSNQEDVTSPMFDPSVEPTQLEREMMEHLAAKHGATNIDGKTTAELKTFVDYMTILKARTEASNAAY